MKITSAIRLYLTVIAVLTLALGAMILFMPVNFYAGYGLDLSGKVDLLNELRAPGLFMLGLAGFCTLGVIRTDLQQPAIWLGSLFNLSYGLSRLLGFAIDGLPHDGFVVAGAVELVLGLVGLSLIWWQTRSRPAPTPLPTARPSR